MRIKVIRTRIFKEREDLTTFVVRYIPKVSENSVIVVTSKVVALSDGRTVLIDPRVSLEKQHETVIKKECNFMMQTPHTWLTVKDGMVMASAGVDESNANGKFILLPKDSFVAARNVRRKLKKRYGVKKLGVLVTDSRILPLRVGVVGVALGYAGFKGIRDYRGTPDIFGRTLKLSRTDVADSLATAAVLCMGEGREQQPLAIITDAPIEFVEKVNRRELTIDPKSDLYAPLFTKLLKKKD